MSTTQAKAKSKPKSTQRTQHHVSKGKTGEAHGLFHFSSSQLSAFYSAGPVFSLDGLVQTKIAIGQPDDPFEREADAVAERVTAGQQVPPISLIPSDGLNNAAQRQMDEEEEPVEETSVQTQLIEPQEMEEESEEKLVQSKFVQRQEMEGEEEPEEESVQSKFIQRQEMEEEESEEASVQPLLVQRQEMGEEEPEEEPVQPQFIQRCECEEKKGRSGQTQMVQRQAKEPAMEEKLEEPSVQADQVPTASTPGLSSMAGAASHAIGHRGSGEPLSSPSQRMLESHLGVDLSPVRVHSDETSREAARALKARAFTHGTDIWLGPGESKNDLRLMAHEVTHVVQQNGNVQRQVIQRDNGDGEAEAPTGTFTLEVLFKDNLITYTLTLNEETLLFLADYPNAQSEVQSFIEQLFTPPSGPIHETPQYVSGYAIKNLIQQDMREWAETGELTLSHLSEFINTRIEALTANELLYGVEQYLESSAGLDPATIDWNIVLPQLQARLPWEPETALEASDFDRYALVLQILQSEASGDEPVEGAVELDLDSLESILYGYVLNVLPIEAFTEETVHLHSEKFLLEWTLVLEGIRHVPEGFDIERFRPSGREEEIAEARESALADFLEFEAPQLSFMFVLDEWTRSGQNPETWLQELDLEVYREQLVDHLTDKFMEKVRENEELLQVLRVAAVEQARFNNLYFIYAMAVGRDGFHDSLIDTFGTTPIEELGDDERAIANDPASYVETASEIAYATRELLSRVSPDGSITAEILSWATEILNALEVPTQFAALFLLPQLVGYITTLQDLIEEQERQAREAIRDGIDVDFETIAEIIRNQAEFAEAFIRDQWIPMLKEVAIEWITQNRDELQEIIDNWDVANEDFILRLEESADEFERLALRLEEGSYESIELNGQIITPDDVQELRDVAQFFRDEAALRRDPERSEEQKEELQEAIDVYETVKEDIESDEYDPLDYSSAVYEEARRRLGISEFEDFTTVGMVLSREVTAEANPFLAWTIVHWHWKEGVERTIETGLLLAGLGILTVAAMLVPGVAGLVLTVLDIGIGIGLGIQGIADARELLNMARLDIHQDIRGISVEDAERALNHAWLSFGATILLTAGPIVLSRALRVRGSGIDLPPAVREWEEGLSAETQALLREQPSLRRLFAEMNPTIRRILTHCTRICIPPGTTAADEARIENIISRMGRDFRDVDERLLREYFYARQANIGEAVTGIERATNINQLRALLRGAASERALDTPTALPPAGASGYPGRWGDIRSRDYGHSVSEHGAANSPTTMMDRAQDPRRAAPNGQWYNDSFIIEAEQRATADTVVEVTGGGKTVHELDMGRPVGRVYMPDGTIVSDVTRVRVIRYPNGTIQTSFPILPVQ
jgi:hypothetical protein